MKCIICVNNQYTCSLAYYQFDGQFMYGMDAALKWHTYDAITYMHSIVVHVDYYTQLDSLIYIQSNYT